MGNKFRSNIAGLHFYRDRARRSVNEREKRATRARRSKGESGDAYQ